MQHENELYTVHTAQHVAKGNKRSYMQVKLKSLKSGNLLDVRFSVDDRIETPYIDTREYEYLYRDGEDFVLMDQTDVRSDPRSRTGHGGRPTSTIKGNEKLLCSMIDGSIVSVELPTVVELAVADTTPAIKGATATNQNKDATMETGLRVKVPPFIENGELLRIDTRTGEYLERAKG